MGFEYRKDTKQWHKVSQQHYDENIGKKFVVKDVHWEPANQYVGKIGKCVDAFISYDNSDVKFIELNIARGIAFGINDLKEIK